MLKHGRDCPGKFSRATLRVHVFAGFFFYVPLSTDIVSRFITNSSSIRQRMRFGFTPVVVNSFSRTPLLHPLSHVNVDNESQKKNIWTKNKLA